MILASNNEHKFREMQGILSALDAQCELLRPGDLGFSFDVDETGETFGENAYKKAFGLYALLRGELRDGVSSTLSPDRVSERLRERLGEAVPPVIADDSGICVHALDNAPGVRSARFGDDTAQPPKNDEERNDLLLRTLENVDDRGAHYVCNAVVVTGMEGYVQAQATWHGTILRERIPGDTGFGYDPIVWLAEYETSVARISQEQKDRISHRAQAVSAVVRSLGII